MKRILILALVALLLPFSALAEDVTIEEYDVSEEAAVEEKTAEEGGAEKAKPTEVEKVEVKIEKTIPIAPSYYLEPRKGSFRAGIVGPGIYAGNKSIDAMMGIGAEAEYFFFERLSAGLKISVATDFKKDAGPNAILSFVPQARYIFDLERHPRWSFYVQGGVGVALFGGKHAAADIAIPAGGFWWQWDEHVSVGFEASLHILARSSVAVAAFAGPSFRCQF